MKQDFLRRIGKKLIYFVLCTIVLCQMAYPVKAESVAEKNSMEVEFLPDGSYFLTTLEDIVPTRHVTAASISRQIQKKKTSNYHDKNGAILWGVTVIGTFVYGNGTARCTKSSVSAVSYKPDIWRIFEKTSSCSGNTATAKAVVKHYENGKVSGITSREVSLSCSPAGIFS